MYSWPLALVAGGCLYGNPVLIVALSGCRGRILAFIVDDFIGGATPAGSQSLVERHAFGLSSATVRNEMAALPGEALIAHPNT